MRHEPGDRCPDCGHAELHDLIGYHMGHRRSDGVECRECGYEYIY